MKKLREILLIIIFSTVPEVSISFVLFGVSVGLYISVSKYYLFIMIFIIIILFTVILRKKSINQNFAYTSSMIYPNIKVISQQNRKKVKSDIIKQICPKKEFQYSLQDLFHKMEDNVIYLCYTQEHIAKLIKRNCKVLILYEGSKSNIKRYSKKIKNEKCIDCTETKSCSVGKDKELKFYAIAFKKK